MARAPEGGVAVTFSEPVMNVTPSTFHVYPARSEDCTATAEALPGSFSADAEGIRFTFTPDLPLDEDGDYCVTIADAVYDLAGRGLAHPYHQVLPRAISAGP